MKSLCIKTNNENSINYLLNELEHLDLENVCFSLRNFKHYENIIIHYKGFDDDIFLNQICNTLSLLIIDELEESLLNKLLFRNYFYFDLNERKQILDLCFDINTFDFTNIFEKKFNSLFNSFYEFLLENKSIVLEGFINFRISNYIEILDDILSDAVNQYVVEKEYVEFISLLKLYINSQKSNCGFVHLIYSKNESILLDENKQIISIENDILNRKYLSDISFSSNDYTLNSLLTLLPKKIYIHLIDNNIDDFINTILSVFENRTHICQNCNICNLYKHTVESKTSKNPNTI